MTKCCQSCLPLVKGLHVVKVCAVVGTARSAAATSNEDIMVCFMVGEEKEESRGRAVARVQIASGSVIPANTDSYCTDKMYNQKWWVWGRVAAVKAFEAGKMFTQSESGTGIYDTLREPNHLIFCQPLR